MPTKWVGGGGGKALASIDPGGLARAAQMSYRLERIPYLPVQRTKFMLMAPFSSPQMATILKGLGHPINFTFGACTYEVC
jgi:hypothetical protein